MKPDTLPNDIDPVLTMKQVVAVVTYSRSQLYKMMKAQRCGSACKKDPVSGVIGVQKGPLISMV